jgi:peptidoglycan hydrolase-like protein with peptidoglycan-binding domain
MTMPRRRGFLLAGAVATVAAVAVTIGLASIRSSDAGTQAGPSLPAATAPVTRQTLTSVVTVAGQLGYGNVTSIVSKAGGTVTWLPRVGAVISRGDPVLRADDEPVVLLYGPLPAYRDLAVHTEGRDVEQFERNLRALGYYGFTVDQTYSAQTARAVKQWQRDLGVPETGTVPVGRLVYAPGRLRVAERKALPGAQAAGEMITASGTTKVVTADVRVADGAWAVRKAAVRVRLPSGRQVAGTVTDVGTEASTSQSGGGGTGGGGGSGGAGGTGGAPQGATVTVTVAIADQRALRGLDRGPVDIGYTADRRRDVLTVPVIALLALTEGGYGLEVVDAGKTRIVAVQTGLVADGRVEVRSPGLRAGQRVGIPG